MRPTPPVSVTGLLLAWLGYVASLTPTMVPRTTAVQVLMSTLLPLTGYAVGAILGALGRLLTGDRRVLGRRPALRRFALGAGALGAVAAVALTPMALQWQQDYTAAAGWSVPSWPVVLVLAPVLFLAGLMLARLLRAAGRGVARGWQRLVRVPALATVLGGLTVAAVAAVLVGVGFALLVAQFDRVDADTTAQQQPESGLRSGGPGSLVDWQGLGRQGREFVAGGPTVEQIEAFSGEPAKEPIRVYVGRDQADSPQARAALLVDELRRTGGLERESVVVVATSGLGSVHPTSAQTLEYVANGDVATAATQFSRVPSWLTSIVDRGGAQREAAALIDALTAAVEGLPPDQRPDLYLSGESLGALGSQQALDGATPEQVTDRFDGVLWVGTPATSQLLREWVRFPAGTPAWEPVVGDGSIARFAASPDRVPLEDSTWGDRRVLFLHSATDPVAYFSGSLLRTRPDWMGAGQFPLLPERMAWWPMFTWEQMLIDFTTNGFVPPGFGHNYSNSHATGWAAVLNPEGWDAARVAALERYRAEVGPPDPGVAAPQAVGAVR
jgi:uncharacterized membrane protein